GDRAESLPHAERAHVRDRRAGRAPPVDSAMLPEALVLDGDERGRDVRRQRIERYDLALDDVEPGQLHAVSVDDDRGTVRNVPVEALDLGAPSHPATLPEQPGQAGDGEHPQESNDAWPSG